MTASCYTLFVASFLSMSAVTQVLAFVPQNLKGLGYLA